MRFTINEAPERDRRPWRGELEARRRMIPSFRTRFNQAWSQARSDAMLAALARRVGGSIPFPVSETPCFLPRALADELVAAGETLIRQALRGNAAREAERAVPDAFRGPGAGARPVFVQVDFGLVREPDGRIAPRLVELQAFPSLYGFQAALGEAYRSAFELEAELDAYLSGLTADEYRAVVGEALVGAHDPAEVVLLEIGPREQKTWPDFVVTEQLWGVRAVDTSEIVREGRRLYCTRDGRRAPIRRIYNRVVPDELERRKITLPFDFRDDLDVEWTGHPAWYFRVSKFSIPWLCHPSVPRTWFLHEVDALPDARERLLLKPLFSFAGGGIVFAPTDEQLASIPRERRSQYILQERIVFEPVIDTPHGPTQAEIRVMYVWTDRLRGVLSLVRMGRGLMMGVDHNRGLRWVGASAAFVS